MSISSPDPLSANSATATTAPAATATNNDPNQPIRIDTVEDDDTFPPSSLVGSDEELLMMSPVEPSESSLIFERSVEDPTQVYQPTQCPRCGKKSSSSGIKCNHQSIVNLPSHYSVENFVSPCLDATTQILTDKNADLENVDMVYSRRPSSVMGLNLALGRTRSSVATDTMQSTSSPVQKTHSIASMTDLESSPNNNTSTINNNTSSAATTTAARPPALSFYSYADMINSENPNPRRPSISQSLSSSFINTRSNSFSLNGSAITPQRTPMTSRPSFSSPYAAPRTLQQQRTNSTSRPSIPGFTSTGQKKFSLDTSPNSSDSESDYVHTRKNSVNSRKSSNYHNRVLNRSVSNQSSLLGSPMAPGRRYSNLDDTCFDASDNESLVVSSVGETLRHNTNEIKSSNNSIIAG